MDGLIYSRWRPDTGGYDYFVSTESQNINDDLPAPELSPASKIGVPSIEAGRPVPRSAEPAGSGELAVGLVAPVDAARIVRRTRSLAGTDFMSSNSGRWALGAVAGAAFLWLVFRKS